MIFTILVLFGFMFWFLATFPVPWAERVAARSVPARRDGVGRRRFGPAYGVKSPKPKSPTACGKMQAVCK